ncbi:hypothetical protein QBC39DRAFT_353791, partial [Podospora conica]
AATIQHCQSVQLVSCKENAAPSHTPPGRKHETIKKSLPVDHPMFIPTTPPLTLPSTHPNPSPNPSTGVPSDTASADNSIGNSLNISSGDNLVSPREDIKPTSSRHQLPSTRQRDLGPYRRPMDSRWSCDTHRLQSTPSVVQILPTPTPTPTPTPRQRCRKRCNIDTPPRHPQDQADGTQTQTQPVRNLSLSRPGTKVRHERR